MSSTRQTFKKSPRDRGMAPITNFLKEFKVGEKASIVIDPTSHKGQPHRRFHGRVGTVVEHRGDAYVVRIEYERIHKDLTIRPEHLKKVP